jgi:NADH:ubiquinone oxidoreductase subunit 6 (subunit J)
VFAVLRVAVIVFAIALAFTMIAWMVTGQPKWRRRSWLIFKYGVFGFLGVLLLFAGEALLEQLRAA